MDNLDTYLTALDEMVEDENKIVTYKCLSQQLAIPISQSKELLKIYAKNSENKMLSTVFCVTGCTKNGIRVAIVKNSDLDKAKSKMLKVTGCHVYSVQQSQVSNPSDLYSADYDMTKGIMYKCASFGPVRYNGSTPLTDEEIGEARNQLTSKAAESENTLKHQPIQAKPKKASTKTNISNMFANSSTKDVFKRVKTESAVETAVTKPEPHKSNTQDQAKGKEAKCKKPEPAMQMFLTKEKGDPFAKSKAPASKVKKEMLSPPSNKSSVTSKKDKPVNDNLHNEEENKEKVKNELPKVDSNQKKPKKPMQKKKSRTNSDDLPAKKRRRIQEFSSSSEDEENAEMQEEEEMEIIPASPKPPPKPSIKNGEKNSRTKRVLKSKTFVDADGSMLTEKVWVEEPSLSGEEDDKNDKQTESIPIKKLSPKANKKPANKKSKQSSLMGFFSKNS